MKTDRKKHVVNRNDIAQIILLLSFVISSFILRQSHREGIIALIALGVIISTIILWAVNIKNYHLNKAFSSGTLQFMLLLSIVYRIMIFIALVFTFANYDGKDIIGLVAILLNLSYIIITFVKKGYKEAIIALIYREVFLSSMMHYLCR